MRYRSSLKTEQKIVEILAKNKEYAQYDLPKVIDKDYRTILRHLQDLETRGIIRLARTETSAKGGKDKKIFTLTDVGLLFALGYSDVWDDIDNVARNYGDVLPLVFGKWNFFVSKGLRNEVVARLKAVVKGLNRQFERGWYRIVQPHVSQAIKIELEKLDKEVADSVRHNYRTLAPTLTQRVLGIAFPLFFAPNAKVTNRQHKFIQTVIEDPEFRDFFDFEFDYWVKEAKKDYESYVVNLNWYNEIKAE